MNAQPTQERKNAMSRARTWIAVLAIGQLAACSSTLTQISPTQPSGSPNGRVGPFLNSPFVLTVVGGLAVAAITTGYSYLKASKEEKLAKDNTLREQQINVLSSVTNDLPTYVSAMGSMRNFREWLEHHDKDSTEVDERGRTRDKIETLYQDYFKLLLQTKNSFSILAQVSSYYEAEQVCNRVKEEVRAIDKIHDATGYKEREEAMKAQDKVFESLLAAMATEIRQRRRNEKFPERKSDWCLFPVSEAPSKD
jgi:hypothetical protein